MDLIPLSRGLLALLALALVVAAATDLRRRQIDNWLSAGVALVAPAYWLASALPSPEIAARVLVALAALAVLVALFALRALGGGDVKLLAALALWFAPAGFVRLIVLMALIGAPLTLACAACRAFAGAARARPIVVPYGVAIAAAGLCVLAGQIDPARAAALAW